MISRAFWVGGYIREMMRVKGVDRNQVSTLGSNRFFVESTQPSEGRNLDAQLWLVLADRGLLFGRGEETTSLR